MKLCIIAPTKGLQLCEPFQFQMALAHMILGDPDYCNYYNKFAHSSGFVILDNSVWELKQAMSAEDLLDACKKIGSVYELILPDAFKSSSETIMETESFLQRIGRHKTWDRNFVVPHGSDREDWLKCYDHFNSQYYTDTIGLPKILDDVWQPGGRVGCCLYLEQTGRIDPSKQYHCLGIRNDPIEVLLLSRFKWIRSLDTALPVHAGLNNIAFDKELGLSRRRPKRPKNFFDMRSEFIGECRDVIDHNIDLMVNWSRGIYTGDLHI